MQQKLFETPQQQLTSDDYYTPRWLFDTLNVHFDLDVASPPHPTNVPCTRYLTQADDALAQPWHGNVWMNPPFSKPQPWVQRFIEHGNGIALLPASKSRWFYELWQTNAAITSLPANFKFQDPKGSNGSILMPIVLIAYGETNKHAIAKLGKVR